MTDTKQATNRRIVNRKNVNKGYDYFFKQQEKLELGSVVAEQAKEIADFEEEIKSTTKDLKETLKGMQAEIRINCRKIRDGYERRWVDTTEIYNLDKKRKEYVYEGKIIATADLTDNEIESLNNEPMFGADGQPAQKVEIPESDYNVKQLIKEETNKKTKSSHV